MKRFLGCHQHVAARAGDRNSTGRLSEIDVQNRKGIGQLRGAASDCDDRLVLVFYIVVLADHPQEGGLAPTLRT